MDLEITNYIHTNETRIHIANKLFIIHVLNNVAKHQVFKLVLMEPATPLIFLLLIFFLFFLFDEARTKVAPVQYMSTAFAMTGSRRTDGILVIRAQWRFAAGRFQKAAFLSIFGRSLTEEAAVSVAVGFQWRFRFLGSVKPLRVRWASLYFKRIPINFFRWQRH